MFRFLGSVPVLLLSILWPAPASAQRLPGTVLPEHYTVSFAPDLEKETFRGRESIQVTITEPTKAITLHAADIQFGEVTITAGGRTQTATVTTDTARETATFTVPETLAEGPATIQITYAGVLNDKLRGFYIGKVNGRKYAASQMEATDARRAFPSFDEPIYKATYDVTLTVDTGDVAFSNGRQVSDTPGPEPGKHTIRFERTPKMSSYLLALIVGDFVCREGSADGTPIRVCSTPDKRSLTAFALEAASVELKFFNNYFGIKYPFKKLDLIGLPDFSAGAMENIGAITFRDRLLLVDPANSSIDVRKRVASVISHEIAHQWFGNLVTMRWWDDIWLNEGFATWMASKPLAAWHPDWQIDLDDSGETLKALGLDALQSTRPIRFKVETPAEINEVFDAIAYEKTAAVLRMIEAFVGAEPFRRGVVSYLKKYSYGNAAGEDFWTEVARVTGKPVDRIMRTFVDQAGAPLLTVRNRCEAGASQLSLGVDRFVGVPDAAPASQGWTLPVCFVASGASVNASARAAAPRCEVVDRRETMLRFDGCSPIFANADSRGYYFTDYTPEQVRAIARNRSSLKTPESINFLGNEWWMIRAGRHDVDVYLDVAEAFSSTTTPAILEMLTERLGDIETIIASADEAPRFAGWVRARFGPALAGLGPVEVNEPDGRQRARAALMTIVGVIGNDSEVQRRARQLAESYLENSRSVPPSLAPTVLVVAAIGGDRALYDRYLAQLGKLSAQPEEYYRLFNALPFFSDPALVKRTLEYALSPAVRSQDAATLIDPLMASPASGGIAWEFVKAQWPFLLKHLDVFQGLPGIVDSLGSFCSIDRAAEVKEFFARNRLPEVDRSVQLAVERIEGCVALDRRQSGAFSRWLKSK